MGTVYKARSEHTVCVLFCGARNQENLLLDINLPHYVISPSDNGPFSLLTQMKVPWVGRSHGPFHAGVADAGEDHRSVEFWTDTVVAERGRPISIIWFVLIFFTKVEIHINADCTRCVGHSLIKGMATE